MPAEGLGALTFGWGVIALNPVGFAWFANPMLAAGLVCQWRGKYAAAFLWAGAATALGLWPLAELVGFWHGAVRPWPDPALTFTLGSGDGIWAMAELRAGYFMWVAAHGLLLAITIVCWRNGRRVPPLADVPNNTPPPEGP